MSDAYLRWAYPVGVLLLVAGFITGLLTRCPW